LSKSNGRTPPLIWPPDASTVDSARLIQLVSALELSQRTEDLDASLALFDPDAVWVTGGGVLHLAAARRRLEDRRRPEHRS
jgi:hypothetical protein